MSGNRTSGHVEKAGCAHEHSHAHAHALVCAWVCSGARRTRSASTSCGGPLSTTARCKSIAARRSCMTLRAGCCAVHVACHFTYVARCALHAACHMLHVAGCIAHVVRCMPDVARCVLRAAGCMLHDQAMLHVACRASLRRLQLLRRALGIPEGRPERILQGRVGAPCPHLHRDWAHPAHVCARTAHTPAHICTGTALTASLIRTATAARRSARRRRRRRAPQCRRSWSRASASPSSLLAALTPRRARSRRWPCGRR